VDEVQEFFDRRFVCERTGKTYIFFGVVWGSDDFYYGMIPVGVGSLKLLSCVGSLDAHGFTLCTEDE
jgi:hypothetical protein